MRKLALSAAGPLTILLCASPAMAAPTVLPQLNRAVAAKGKAATSCPNNATRRARGAALTRYRAPMSGFVTVRLARARRLGPGRGRRGRGPLAWHEPRLRKSRGRAGLGRSRPEAFHRELP